MNAYEVIQPIDTPPEEVNAKSMREFLNMGDDLVRQAVNDSPQ